MNLVRKDYALMLLFAFAAFPPSFTYAFDGNELYMFWLSNQRVDKGGSRAPKDLIEGAIFPAFVKGVLEAQLLPQNFKNCPFHIPNENIVNQQLVEVVAKYLENHPEKRHLRGGQIVLDAMAEAFPKPRAN